MNYLFDVPANNITMVILIVVITAIAMISVLTGINVGIKRLSQFNVILAFLLLVAVIILGPTLYIFRSMFDGLVGYVVKIVPLSNWIGREDTGFFHGWTTFYWAWWIAWAPFVGTFIARISKGRYGTPIRNLRVTLADTGMFTLVWRLWRHCPSPTPRRGLYRCDRECQVGTRAFQNVRSTAG